MAVARSRPSTDTALLLLYFFSPVGMFLVGRYVEGEGLTSYRVTAAGRRS